AIKQLGEHFEPRILRNEQQAAKAAVSSIIAGEQEGQPRVQIGESGAGAVAAIPAAQRWRHGVFPNLFLPFRHEVGVIAVGDAHGDHAVSKMTVSRWVGEFQAGRTDASNMPRSGRPAIRDSSSLTDRILDLIDEDCHQSIREMADRLDCPKSTVHECLPKMNHVKLSACWVPRLLTEVMKLDCKQKCVNNLELVNQHGGWEAFRELIVTGNETWVQESMVRANNLQDLVYKSGQAGVTKATVSIVFDNTDKNQKPLGYEDYEEITITRQIVIGGRNKYLINGNCAPNNRVHDLFHSVQLNINNPHFLIMQGRITKVLNMKPPEILSLLEEAAGTKLYETKKEQAQKTIEKKDFKLREIESLLASEILPTLTKLRKERHVYQEYQQVCREVEFLQHFTVAYRYYCYEQTKEKADIEVVEAREKTALLQEEQQQAQKQLSALSEEADRLCRERDEQSGRGLEEREELHKAALQEEALAQSALVAAADAVKAEEKRMRELDKALLARQKALAGKEKDFERVRDSFQELEQRMAAAEAEMAAAEKHLQAVSSGLAANEEGGEAASLEMQLCTTRNEISEAESRIKRSELKSRHLQSEIKEKRSQLGRMQSSASTEQKQLDNYKRSVAHLEIFDRRVTVRQAASRHRGDSPSPPPQKQLAETGFDEAAEQRLLERQSALQRELHETGRHLEEFQSANPRLGFDYTDPEPRFDRRRVLGPVCQLLEAVDEKFAVALEVTAGAKLFNVVVDTEATAKLLLQRGQLRQKTTFIPLNKISARCLPKHQADLAVQVAGQGRAYPALDLVRRDKSVEAAAQFVFGASFVVQDDEAGRKVAFHRDIRRRAVTLEGEVYSPEGTLSGGFRGSREPTLLKAAKLRQLRERAEATRRQLAEVAESVRQAEASAGRYQQLRQDLDQKRHELALLEQRIGNTDHQQLAKHLEELQAELDSEQTAAAEANAALKRLREREASLAEQVKDAAAVQEREMKAAQARIAKAQHEREARRADVENWQPQHDTLQLEIEELRKEAASLEEQIAAAKESVEARSGEVQEKRAEAEALKQALDEAKRQLEEKRAEIKARNQAIRDLEEQAKALQSEVSQRELRLANLQHQLADQAKEAADAQHKVNELLASHPWIESEKRHFNQPGGHFDFQRARLTKLEERKERLGKSVNMRAMNMLTTAEQQYADLVGKRDIVLTDKAKIQGIIDELDKKKNEALMTAYKK
uniref:Structural maintenance of chromosomes protein n=1 Tax=Macrostomum lignano TaxID=282301 RepID=A0A1I8IKR6_9PLAT